MNSLLDNNIPDIIEEEAVPAAKSNKLNPKKVSQTKENHRLLQKEVELALEKILPDIQNILIANKNKTFIMLKKNFAGSNKVYRILLTCKSYR